jgi:predicted RNA-binding Zn-ribbon protein involved in translation (DUF1610 family)
MSSNSKIKYEDCPRCGKQRLHKSTLMNALSRRDNATYICSPCGSHEALLDASRHDPALAAQLAEFMAEDIDGPFEILTEEQEAQLWVSPM